METVKDFILGSKLTADGDYSHEIKKILAPWRKTYDPPRQPIQNQRHCVAKKGPHIQSYGFFRSHVWLCELGCKESWGPKNCCFSIVVLEKTIESPLDCKEIQPIHPKGDKT